MELNQFKSFESFEQYWERIQALFAAGKTTGEIQTDAMLNYTHLSLTRTKRGLSHYTLSDDLKNAAQQTKATNWLIITEAWCGDASNTIPIMELAAKSNASIDLRVMVRDEHPEIMNNYLTNGSKSIPVLVLMDANGVELGKWGPRPAACQEFVIESKKDTTITHEELMVLIQKWYLKDATQTTQAELATLLNSL